MLWLGERLSPLPNTIVGRVWPLLRGTAAADRRGSVVEYDVEGGIGSFSLCPTKFFDSDAGIKENLLVGLVAPD